MIRCIVGLTCCSSRVFLCISHQQRVCCSYELFFREPISHTLLHGLCRGFLELICHTTNGIYTLHKGKLTGFWLPVDIQKRLDEIIDAIHLTSAFNRSAKKFRQCAPLCRSRCEARGALRHVNYVSL